MRPLRLLILLLVVANGLAYVWFTRPMERPAPPPAPGTETRRLVLLSERVAAREAGKGSVAPAAPVSSPAPPDPAASSSGPETPAEVPSGPPAAAPVPQEPHEHCLAAGPFPTPEARKAFREALEGLAATGFIDRDERLDDSVTWWVALPRHERLGDARAIEAAIAARGIEDIAVIPIEQGYVVSLGLFRSRSVAKRRQREIGALGYEVLIHERRRPRRRHWLDLRLPADVAAPTIEDLARRHPELDLSGIELRETACQ